MVTSVRVAQLAREVLRDGEGAIRVGQVAREALVDGQGWVRVSQVYRSTLRSTRTSPYPNFPVRLFRPPSLSARLEGGGLSGGASLSGDQQVEAMDAGARWVMTFGETALWDRDLVLAWRRFVAAADLGVMNLVIPLWDRLYQPFAEAAYTGDSAFGREVWFDSQVWEAEAVQASVTAEAAQFATEIDCAFVGGDLAGGEHFSIYGPRYGWRLYRAIRIKGDTDGVKTIEIRPPLREAVPADTPLNFDSPRCTMRSEGDISEVVELLRLGRGAATFVESFARYP